ncbi:MAG: hypothetical protein HUJ70_15660 [Pseudobutyrivibrio sp.]|nr:hypothetical protein [Pseudobutyrivibrio sp.]MCF0185892.1 hypothetical protein [Bacteroidaceae bacterium]
MSRRSMPMAYITASWADCKTSAQVAKTAQSYCDRLKEAGFLPVCPDMYLSMFLKRNNAKDKVIYKEMSEELLRRCRVLVVCDDPGGERVASDVAMAKRLRITVTSLDGIESVERYLEADR